MKKELSVFLVVLAALLFGSCADLSKDNEAALAADLPKDFDWQVYAEINRDVATSQIIFAIGEKNKAFGTGTGSIKLDSAKLAVPNCVNLLSDQNFAEEIYLNYAHCPREGWYREEKCTGIYANNNNYSTAITETYIVKIDTIHTLNDFGEEIIGKIDTTNRTDTIGWRCVIGGCWRGGWDQLSTKDEECTGDDVEDWGKDWCSYGRLGTLNVILPDSLNNYLTRTAAATSIANANPTFDPIKTLCMFMPKAESSAEAKNYLKNFYYLNGTETVYGSEFSPILVQEHYHSIGRYDGRSYKYCEEQEIGVEKTTALATVRNAYYDYGAYTFCFNKNDQKIYAIK